MESPVKNQKLNWSSGKTITLWPGFTARLCVMVPRSYGFYSRNAIQTQTSVLMSTALLLTMRHCQNTITTSTTHARLSNKPSLISYGTAEHIRRIYTSYSPSRNSSLARMPSSMNMFAKRPTPGMKLATLTSTSSSETAIHSTWVWERISTNLTQRMPKS